MENRKRKVMSKKIEKLTPEQIARFPEFVERWTNIGLSTAPADRPRAEKLPDGLKKAEPENGKIIVTHSETGHHHVMEANDAEMFQGPDLLTAFLLVRKTTRLEHLRPHDTHEAIAFEPGSYEVRRQREHVPEGFRRVAD